MRKIVREEGYITVYAVTLLSLVFLLGSVAVGLAAQHRKIALRALSLTQAYYIAEAGIEKVLADPGWLNTLPVDRDGTFEGDYYDSATYLSNQNYAGGSLTVKAVRKPPVNGHNLYRIYATGRYGNTTRVLKVEAQVPLTSFDQGILAGGNVAISGFSSVNSNVQSGGHLNNTCTMINGNASALGDITIENMGRITGNASSGNNATVSLSSIEGDLKAARDVTTLGTIASYTNIGGGVRAGRNASINFSYVRGSVVAKNSVSTSFSIVEGSSYIDPNLVVQPPAIPGVADLSSYRSWFEEMADQKYTGDRSFYTTDLQPLQGLTFIDGKVNIRGEYSGQGTIVATGKITVNNDLKPRDSSRDLIILISLNDDLEIKGNAQGLFYAGKNIVINSLSDEVKGALLAKQNITITSSTFTFESSMLARQPAGSTGPVKITRWEEKY
ncbi:MAG: hypothetical protein QHH75_08310 [Bacillota bacterium]|nr:hypothetical protein [Bacillota bacterium]